MIRSLFTGLLVCVLVVAIGCGKDNDNPPTPAPDSGSSEEAGENTPAEEPADDSNPGSNAAETPEPQEATKELTPKETIALQLQLLKDQNVEELKTHFTDRLKDKVTAEAVAAAQDQAGGASMEDLVATIETDESDGNETARVYMPGGRTLTTLIKVDGRWLADTIWFQ